MGLFDYRFRSEKNEEEKQKPFIRFFRILYSKIWELTKLNLLYLVFLLPTFFMVFLFLAGVITNGMFQGEYGVLYEIFVRLIISSFFAVFWGMGPVTAGITTVLIKYVKGEHTFILSDFFGSIKTNFKQSLLVFLIDIFAFVVLYAGVLFYGNMPGLFGIVASILIISVVLIYTMMHFYIYPIMIKFDLNLWHIYYNSLIYTIGKMPRTILTLLIVLFIHTGLIYIISNFAIGVLFLLLGVATIYALSGFIVNFNVYENMRGYIDVNRTHTEND